MTSPAETLKATEQKNNQTQAINPVSLKIDYRHTQEILANRFAKLEKIKFEIPLKTYDLILEKLQNEKQLLEDKVQNADATAQRDNAPQSLPKSYFEKRPLKKKLIKAA